MMKPKHLDRVSMGHYAQTCDTGMAMVILNLDSIVEIAGNSIALNIAAMPMNYLDDKSRKELFNYDNFREELFNFSDEFLQFL